MEKFITHAKKIQTVIHIFMFMYVDIFQRMCYIKRNCKSWNVEAQRVRRTEEASKREGVLLSRFRYSLACFVSFALTLASRVCKIEAIIYCARI